MRKVRLLITIKFEKQILMNIMSFDPGLNKQVPEVKFSRTR